jgi:2-amino-4-hydroxy-6-hydroxymethyldihydropteridine diphosphokinase
VRAAFSSLEGILGQARLSSLWRSRARYVEEQPDFVNAVATGYTSLDPLALLGAVNAIEASFGRDRGLETRRGPRPLDIDILLYGDRLIALPGLIVPHAGLRDRKFALLPLLELAPHLRDPASGEAFSTILSRLPPQGIYLIEGGGYDPAYL